MPRSCHRKSSRGTKPCSRRGIGRKTGYHPSNRVSDMCGGLSQVDSWSEIVAFSYASAPSTNPDTY